MKKEYHLVIGFDTANEGLQQQVLELVRQSARDVWGAVHLAHAAMDPTSPKPDLHLYSDDFVAGKEDLGLEDKTEDKDDTDAGRKSG